MRTAKIRRGSWVLVIIGTVLILGAAGLLAYTMISAERSVRNGEQLLSKVESHLPAVTDQVPEERRDNTMASMEVDGVNIVGIIEVPKYDCKLPLHATWSTGTVSSMPCRYDGSIYDRTLIIGASDGEGQMDFADRIDVDDRICLTDMEGGRYTYKVSKIQHSDSAKTEVLQSSEYDLTIFVKDSLSLEYIIIRCETS